MKRTKKSGRFGLLLLFILVLFAASLINSIITTMIVYLLVHNGVLTVTSNTLLDTGKLMLMSAVVSIPIGLVVSTVIGKAPLKPVRDLIDGMDHLAAGDLKTRMKVGPVMRHYPSFVAAADSFNKMAEELEKTETLRSDFINNFSHEFKTPIVSIAGFAKLLRHGNLPREQQQEYLAVIEQEALRLSDMATNVLNLTKVESQTVLSNVTEFNLSEQIRSCILLLERKWSQKDLELDLDFGEHQIHADEELLKQVWINLLDNAVKFTPEGHTIQVQIADTGDHLSVTVRNTGSEIPKEKQEKIFRKFYQADESHSTQGNGIGLAIAKRITGLHGGSVSVSSENDVTAFTVTLPK